MTEKQPAGASLPARTVKYVQDIEQITEAVVRGIISNPVYAGVPPYRRTVSDEAWIQAATQLINEEGPEQFLVNMLYVLKASMVDAVPDEAIPADYDGPWPDDEDEEDLSSAGQVDPDEALSPWRHPLEGIIYCSHDSCPMLLFGEEFVCVAEYLLAHLNGAAVTDLMTDPVLTLVFQNGHTLPLLCPDCGQSIHLDDTELLDNVHGLTLIDIEWEPDEEGLILSFGRPDEYDPDQNNTLYSVVVHLDSVRRITCPHQHPWDETE